MSKRNDLTGRKFGRLSVLRIDHRDKTHKAYYLCKCDCGNIVVKEGSKLLSGNTKSCGCLQRESRIACKTIHGKRRTRLYSVWCGIRRRCYDTQDKDYVNYGMRRIRVCDEWRNDFKAFYDWAMANGYDENAPTGQCTIDRIDVNGNYEPSNCRWVSRQVQNNNKRCTKKYLVDGKVMSIGDIARKYGVKTYLIRSWERSRMGLVAHLSELDTHIPTVLTL